MNASLVAENPKKIIDEIIEHGFRGAKSILGMSRGALYDLTRRSDLQSYYEARQAEKKVNRWLAKEYADDLNTDALKLCESFLFGSKTSYVVHALHLLRVFQEKLYLTKCHPAEQRKMATFAEYIKCTYPNVSPSEVSRDIRFAQVWSACVPKEAQNIAQAIKTNPIERESFSRELVKFEDPEQWRHIVQTARKRAIDSKVPVTARLIGEVAQELYPKTLSKKEKPTLDWHQVKNLVHDLEKLACGFKTCDLVVSRQLARIAEGLKNRCNLAGPPARN